MKKPTVPLSFCRLKRLLAGFALFLSATAIPSGQTSFPPQPWRYLLLHDSYLLDDCLICGRPTIIEAMRGAFDLQVIEQNTLFTRYALENIDFTAGERPYLVHGSGTLEIGGEVAVTVRVFLQAEINDGFTNKLGYFTNATQTLDRTWPMMDLTLVQTNGTPGQTYTLRLAAAPIREIWFSTAKSFYSLALNKTVFEGDLLSSSGRIVKSNEELYLLIGGMCCISDVGLDAFDVLPGGELALSIRQWFYSEEIGAIGPGDLVGCQIGTGIKRTIAHNHDLVAAFVPDPPPSDVGLDAVHVLIGEIWFSTPSNFVSRFPRFPMHRGDLLSNKGIIIRSNQQLLSRFHPVNATNDYGLDALYIWPNGELWFSTQDDLEDQSLGLIHHGDLLSDQGYIAFRSDQLTKAFRPGLTNAPPDVGLDALYLITDATPPEPAPRFVVAGTFSIKPLPGELIWRAGGRVFQVERAERVMGPFVPISPIIPDLFFTDPMARTNRSQGYYRLGQW